MRIAFFSTMQGMPWGGSEELWSRAANVLLARGHDVYFNCIRWQAVAAPLGRLIEAGAVPKFRPRWRMGRTLRRTLEQLRLLQLKHRSWLKKSRPDFVVISFSCHTDDPQIALTCQKMGIRYAIVLQAAGPNHWIDSRSLEDFRAAYLHAERCYFVSADNRDTLLTNVALNLTNCEIVDNPFSVRPEADPAWPATEPHWKLACVARIHFPTKSQDLIVRALQAPKWRNRPLKVTFWGGNNGNLWQLQQLISTLR